MKALLEAIVTKFGATSALTTAFPGGIHHGHAPKGEARPFVVMRVVSAPATPAYGAPFLMADYVIDFVGLAGTGDTLVSATVLMTRMETLATAFDGGVTLAAGTLTNVTRVSDVIPVAVPPEDEAGQDEWQATVTYLFSVAP